MLSVYSFFVYILHSLSLCIMTQHKLARLHEFDLQIDALARGIASIVPIDVLSIFTWKQLEVLIAGNPEIDLDLLRTQKVFESL